MTFKETLQAKLTEARKSKNFLQMGLLQHILGETSTQEARAGGKASSDEQVEAIVRKTIKGNYVSLAMIALGEATDEDTDAVSKKISEGNQELLAVIRTKNPDALDKATNECSFLMSLLPKTLTVEEIKVELSEMTDKIQAANNEGAAMGIAMKVVKSKNLKALGDNVKKAVQEIRL